MKIDISVVTYNASKWLDKFFISLLAQDYPVQYLNIFVRDNASTDDTLIILRKIQKKFGKQFACFEISMGENKGFGYGHNRNAEKGRSDYFLVCNFDLEFEKTAIGEIIALANSDNNKVYGSFEFRQKPYEHPKYYNPVTLETEWSSSACVLFQKQAFNAVNGYEERIFLYGEDVDISHRLRDKGYNLLYCPKAVCWHYSYDEPGVRKAQQFFGNLLANFYLRLRYGTFIEIITGVLLCLAAFAVPIKLPNRLSKLAGYFLQLLKNTPYFLRTRKKIAIKFNKTDFGWRRQGAFYQLSAISDNTPLVTVMIRTFGGRLDCLKQSITTVLNQTYPAIELVVIEDGSETAKGFIEKLVQKKLLKRIVYESIEKQGRSSAGNRALELAQGEFVVFLDDDDLFFADHVEVLAKKLIDNPHLGATYSVAAEVNSFSREPRVVWRQLFSRELLLTRNYLPIQSVLFKRALYLQKGGFNLSLDVLEDWDLWLRYSAQAEFVLVEKLTSLYYVPFSPVHAYQRKKIFLQAYTLMGKPKTWRYFLNKLQMSSYVLYYISAILQKYLRVVDVFTVCKK